MSSPSASSSKGTGRLVLVTSVADDLRVMPQFLDYYRRRGVEEFYVNITDQVGDGKILRRCKQLLSRYPHRITHVRVGLQRWSEQSEMIRKTIQKYCQPNDWVLLPDLDELHEYPDQLVTFLGQCNRRDINLVTGEFMDRISRTGELIDLCDRTPLFAQFPLGCRISTKVLGVPRLRTVAVRGDVFVERHFATSEDPAVARGVANGSIRPTPSPAVTVHHFKWHSRVRNKLRARRNHYRRLHKNGDSRFALHRESQRLLDYFKKRGDRIDVNDPHLEVTPIFDIKSNN